MCFIALHVDFLTFFTGEHYTCKSPPIICRAYYNYWKVVVGLFASSILLTTVVWMFHHPQLTYSKASITSPNTLGLIWVSAHSISLQDFTKTGSFIPGQLRLKGMKVEVCHANMESEPIRLLGSTDHDIQMDGKVHSPSWQTYTISEGLSLFIPV